MKHIAFSITLILFFTVLLPAHAATDQEMEKARVATIKACLRNMRNGADYLDHISPSSLDDLQSKLKKYDQQNFEYLKGLAVAQAKQYNGWDNAAFQNYWSKTFVNQIDEKISADFKRGFCSSKVAEAVAGMKSTVVENTPAPGQEEAVTTDSASAAVQQPAIASEPAQEPVPGGAQLQPQDEMVKPQTMPAKKDNSNTGAIVVLCILVVVVIALVGYALNVMKKNKARQGKASRPTRRHDEEPEYGDYAYDGATTVQNDPEEESPFAAYSGSYAEPQPDPRDREIERLRAEIAALQSQVGKPQPGAAPRPAVRRNQPRVIYLAQANAEGVFTRADARFNMGNSIFKLVTTDGISGSFSVIEDPAVYELALMMPTDFLVNACSGQNLQLSEGARSIINEASGTAIFEDGRWRVSRKARIRYVK